MILSRRKQRAAIRRLLGSASAANVQQGIALLESLGDPSLAAELGAGLRLDVVCRPRIARGTSLHRTVRAAHREWVAEQLHRLAAVPKVGVDLANDSMTVMPSVALGGAVTWVDLSRCWSLTDVSALRGLPSVRRLDLSLCGRLGDLTPVAALTQLEDLDLSYTRVRCLEPLRGLEQLRRLVLPAILEPLDLSPLRDHPQLEDLSVEIGTPAELEVLASLPRLRSLALAHPKPLRHAVAGFVVKRPRLEVVEWDAGIPF